MTIDELLDRARRRLSRVEPEQAAAELAQGALLVDIRPADQRADGGDIPGATVIDRNVLEWRLDPASPWKIGAVTGSDVRVIVALGGFAWRAALEMVGRGEASLGIVYETDAKVEKNVKIVGHFPEDSHPPITYPVALTANARPIP